MIILRQGAKNWDDPLKKKARRVTIINPYRLIFGKCLPSKKQYWTLCGEMAFNSHIQHGCELHQMVEEKLISPNQFHGIEGNRDIHELNTEALKGSSYDEAHLYNGEFTDVLDKALGEKSLNPGIVYLDTIQEPYGSVILLSKTLSILNNIHGSVLLVWNFIKESGYCERSYLWGSVMEEFKKNQLFLKSIRGWEQFGGDKVFWYGGTGKSSTTMGTVVFFRRDD